MTEWTGISGSSADDTAECPARMALPSCNATGDYAERGNILHEFARKTVLYPAKRKDWLAEITDDDIRLTAEGMDLEEALQGITVTRCEPAYVLNVKERTCRYLGDNIHREYAKYTTLTKYDIPFSIDVEGRTSDGVLVELDFKSGMSVGDIEEHGQRKVCTAGLMYFYDETEAIGQIRYIEPTGFMRPDGAEFTVFDADAFCDRMAEAVEAVYAAREIVAAGGIPAVYPNRDKQCKYCNAFTCCPYWNNLLKGALGQMEGLGDLKATDAEQAGKAMDLVKQILKVAKAAEEQLKERANREPLIVDEKFEYSAKDTAGKSYFDQSAARGELVIAWGKQGLSEEEIATKLASLNKKGASFPTVTKRKRELPVLQAVELERKAG